MSGEIILTNIWIIRFIPADGEFLEPVGDINKSLEGVDDGILEQYLILVDNQTRGGEDAELGLGETVIVPGDQNGDNEGLNSGVPEEGDC